MAFKHTEETKKKLSEMRKGERNPFYGKKHTPETLKKLSEATTRFNKNRTYDIEPMKLKIFDEIVCAYVAGLIDGEGSITAHHGRQVVYIYNCDEGLMRWLRRNVGRDYRVAHENGREPNYIWSAAAARDVYYLLTRVRRYLVIKQGRADIAMKALEEKYGERLERKEGSAHGR